MLLFFWTLRQRHCSGYLQHGPLLFGEHHLPEERDEALPARTRGERVGDVETVRRMRGDRPHRVELGSGEDEIVPARERTDTLR